LGFVIGNEVLALNEIAHLGPSKWDMFADAADITPLFSGIGKPRLQELEEELAGGKIPEEWMGSCSKA
jgi:hypothetical protein